MPKENNAARNLAPVHLEIWRELQKMFVDYLYDKEEFILPRGCSKSTIINKALSCYTHAYLISRYTIVIGSTESDVICDYVLSENDILSNNAKEKVLNKYYKEISEVGDSAVCRSGKKIKSATKFIVIGTPLAPDDFINEIRLDSTFKIFHKKNKGSVNTIEFCGGRNK